MAMTQSDVAAVTKEKWADDPKKKKKKDAMADMLANALTKKK